MSERESLRGLIGDAVGEANLLRRNADRESRDSDPRDRIEFALLLIAGALVAPPDPPAGPVDIAEAREREIAAEVTGPLAEQLAGAIMGGEMTDGPREIIARFSKLFTDGKNWRPPA